MPKEGAEQNTPDAVFKMMASPSRHSKLGQQPKLGLFRLNSIGGTNLNSGRPTMSTRGDGPISNLKLTSFQPNDSEGDENVRDSCIEGVMEG